MDFRDFLVIAYIPIQVVGCTLAMPTSKSSVVAEKNKGCPKIWFGVALEFTWVAFGFHLVGFKVG